MKSDGNAGDLRSVRKGGRTPFPAALSAASTSGLPLDLLQEASKRLGWAGLAYAGTFFLAYFGADLFFSASESTVLPEQGLFHAERALQTIVAILSIALGLAVFLLSRYGRMRPQTLLDFGLVFEVVGAFGISMSTFWGIYSQWDGVFATEFSGIPWECVWIILFPFLAPNTPGKTLLASLAAASTGMLTVTLSKAAGLTSPEVPLGLLFGWFLFTTYLCAGLAFVISRTVYRFGKRYGRLRDVGSYQLVKPLGEGGMGEVWMARHRMLARPAAVKLIRPEVLGRDEDSRNIILRRFEREARATAALDSKHTITLYDFGITEQGAFYYVMELLKGLNLDALVERFGPVPAARTVHLMRQVCHSLGEAHVSGMIHRDIKPANIHVCRLGPDYDFVKVLDFGIVKAIEAHGRRGTELTADGIAVGTPAFMAPELALGKPDVDGRVDIYGLGCVGYWLLTGEPVFDAEIPLANVVAHVQEQPIPPSQRTELEVPEPLERIILSCLEKDPAGRPQSAAELDALLVECGLEAGWSQNQAAEWWSLHMPESEFPTLDAEGEALAERELLTVIRWAGDL